MLRIKLFLLAALVLIPALAEAASMLTDGHGNIYTAERHAVFCRTPDGERVEVARFEAAVLDIAMSRRGRLFALDTDGTVWALSRTGGRRPVLRDAENASAITVDRDGKLLIGNGNGGIRALRP